MSEDMIATAMSENLLLVYPTGPPADEALIRNWLQEIVESESIKRKIQKNDGDDANMDAVAFDGEDPTPLYERALERAIQEWKEKASDTPPEIVDSQKPPKKQSFSLFSQMGGGGFSLEPPMAIEDLQAASSPHEKFSLLQKVTHLEDILLDWKDVFPILKETFQVSIKESCVLHRKWFEEGRASTEHFPIRCDLCQNILAAIFQLITTPTTKRDKTDEETFQENLFALWNVWHPMWMDLTQEPVSANEDSLVANTGYQALLLITEIDCGNGIVPAHYLALVDPMATWFQAWTARMVPAELVHLLQSTSVLPDLWSRATATTETVLLEDCKSTTELCTVALKHHSLSMLKSMLICTRVQWFPSGLLWVPGQTTPVASSPKTLLWLTANYESFEKNKDTKLLANYTGISQEQLRCLFGPVNDVWDLCSDDTKSGKALGIMCSDMMGILLDWTMSQDDDVE